MATGLFIGVLVAPAPPPASANWFGNTGAFGRCRFDAGFIPQDHNLSFHYVDESDPENQSTKATNWVRSNLIDPLPVMSTSYDSSEKTSTDIVVIARDYDDYCYDVWPSTLRWTSDGSTELLGFTQCDYVVASGRCDQANVRNDLDYFNNHDANHDRFEICHEVGHAMGLSHRDEDACMNVGVYHPPRYSNHDENHLTSNWGTEPAS